MTFKITIKEVHEAVVEIDAENYYEALAKLNPITGRTQTIIYSNRKTQHLNKNKAPPNGGALSLPLIC